MSDRAAQARQAVRAWEKWLIDLAEADPGPGLDSWHRLDIHDAFLDGYLAGAAQRSVGLQVIHGLLEMARLAVLWSILFGLVYFGYLAVFASGRRP